MTDIEPRIATCEVDGWALVDAEAKLAARDGLYWIPSRWEREHLDDHVPEDGVVKLVFRIAAPTPGGQTAIERMWVQLESQHGEWYHGHLANQPHTGGALHEGTTVWFRAEHVIDYADAEGRGRASEQGEVVQCRSHGASSRCYVCEHLDPASEGRGFHTRDLEAERPDAWCDECDRLLAPGDDWDALEDRHPRIKLVCGGCYDALRVRNERRPSANGNTEVPSE